MPEKEYKVKSASRMIAVVVGLAFALVGLLVAVVLGTIGWAVLLIGLIIWLACGLTVCGSCRHSQVHNIGVSVIL
jgi:fatty acid desaturase